MYKELKREELCEFIIRLEYRTNESQVEKASGVILKIDEKLAYILTAKHTFKSSNIDTKKITVIDYWDREIQVDEKYLLENNLDIVILKIDNNSMPIIDKTKKIKLYMGEFNDCAIAGYPKSLKGTKSEIIQMSNPDEIDATSISFQIKAKEPLNSFENSEMDNLKGLSGSGVFKRGIDGEIFLVGIQYKYMRTIYLECLDIRQLVKEIQSQIGKELLLGEYPFFEELGIDVKKLNFESLENTFKINKEIRKIQKSSNQYQFLLEDNRTNRKLEKDYHNLKKEMREVAQRYFYQGKIFVDNKDMLRAYNSFSRAIELSPEYKIYLSKDAFKKSVLTDEQEKARDKLRDEVKPSIDSVIYEQVLRDNIESNKKNNNYEDLEFNYRELLSFYYTNFLKYRREIIDLLKKLAKIKLFNKKPIEAERILFEAKSHLENDNKEDIDILLIELYMSETYIQDNSVSYKELYQKLLDLQQKIPKRSDYYIFISKTLNQIKIYNSYSNDCFIEHLERQRREIHGLKSLNKSYLLELQTKPKVVVKRYIDRSPKLYIVGIISLVAIICITSIFMNIDKIKAFLGT
jgi:hypothetical protein